MLRWRALRSRSVWASVEVVIAHVLRRWDSDGRKMSEPSLVRDVYRSTLRRPSLRAMGSSYHQFCPVAKAMELLDERWTLLVIRELLAGSRHFNDLRRGVPRMSPALLSKRLQQLVRAGIVDRRDDGQEIAYVLTVAGEELRSVVESLGAWG